jgi:UPF0755 protein
VRRLFIFSFLVVGLLGLGWHQFQVYLHSPVGGDVQQIYRVEHGASMRGTLRGLEKQGILRYSSLLYLYARQTHRLRVQVGYYDVSANQSPLDILDMLNAGQVKIGELTFAEGWNRFQIRDKLVQGNWMTAADFDRLCDDYDFLLKHNIPGPTCEGYLFPETYRFALGIEPERIFATLFATFRKNFDEVLRSGRGPLSLSDQDLTTLAAIVEKETAASVERPHIACVFYNRLKAKPAWRLETDPTVIYGLLDSNVPYDGNIKRKHFNFLSPYNTYQVFGLPKGPIANPGRAALEAVVAPSNCRDFFFVSMNNGQHVFCPTIACHLNAVQKWQRQFFRNQRRVVGAKPKTR